MVFLEKFTDHFFAALDVAKKLGIQLITPTLKNSETIADRFCSGDFCLTPLGTISVCHRFSSPHEAHYQQCIYGAVKDSEVRINEEAFQRLMQQNVYTDKHCEACFAKWHCGGHCLAHCYTYGKDELEVLCGFIRRFTLRCILEDLERHSVYLLDGERLHYSNLQ